MLKRGMMSDLFKPKFLKKVSFSWFIRTKCVCVSQMEGFWLSNSVNLWQNQHLTDHKGSFNLSNSPDTEAAMEQRMWTHLCTLSCFPTFVSLWFGKFRARSLCRDPTIENNGSLQCLLSGCTGTDPAPIAKEEAMFEHFPWALTMTPPSGFSQRLVTGNW